MALSKKINVSPLMVFAPPRRDPNVDGLVLFDNDFGDLATGPQLFFAMYGEWASVPGFPYPDGTIPMALGDGIADWGSMAVVSDWMTARGYVLGVLHVGNDFGGKRYINIFFRSASGYHAVGKWTIASDDDGSAGFGMVMMFAAGVVTGGTAYAAIAPAGQSVVNGDYTGAALSIAKSYAGADTPAGPGGTSMFDDIDTSTFDSFNYSAGEASVAFSDAQNVDYGFGFMGTGGLPFDPNETVGFGAMSDPTGNIASYDYGSTPEVTSNQFGTHFDPSFSDDVIGTAGRNGIPIATQIIGKVANSTRPSQTGQRSGGGALGAKGDGTGSNDVIGTLAGVLSTVAGVVTSAQETTARPRAYHGQLTPVGGAGGAGSHSNLMMIAAALIGVALVMHLGK